MFFSIEWYKIWLTWNLRPKIGYNRLSSTFNCPIGQTLWCDYSDASAQINHIPYCIKCIICCSSGRITVLVFDNFDRIITKISSQDACRLLKCHFSICENMIYCHFDKVCEITKLTSSPS